MIEKNETRLITHTISGLINKNFGCYDFQKKLWSPMTQHRGYTTFKLFKKTTM